VYQQQNRRVRIHGDFFDEVKTPLPVGVREPVKQRVMIRAFALVEQVMPLLALPLCCS
jgi:hypothetical protein